MDETVPEAASLNQALSDPYPMEEGKVAAATPPYDMRMASGYGGLMEVGIIPTSACQQQAPPAQSSEPSPSTPPHKQQEVAAASVISITALLRAVKDETWSLDVSHFSRSTFTTFKCCPRRTSPSMAFVAYRVCVCAYWLGWVLVSAVGTARGVRLPFPLYSKGEAKEYWAIYISDWTALLLACYLLSACACMWMDDGGDRHSTYGVFVRRLRQLSWSLRTTSAVSCCLVTGLYWTTVFPVEMATSLTDAHVHVVNTLIALTDVAFTRLPIYLRHFYLPLVYMLVYILFTVVYYACGGKNESGGTAVYPLLDYRGAFFFNTTLPTMTVVLFLVFPLFHVLVWLLDRWSRQWFSMSDTDVTSPMSSERRSFLRPAILLTPQSAQPHHLQSPTTHT